jgi:hypothetical protein
MISAGFRDDFLTQTTSGINCPAAGTENKRKKKKILI